MTNYQKCSPYSDKYDNLESLRNNIISLVQQSVKENRNFKTLTHEDLATLVFARPNSIRLTYTGSLLLGKVIKCYKFEHSMPMNANTYINIDKLKFPFYINAVTFISFSEEESFLLSLHGGDLELFLSKIGDTAEN